MTNNYKIYIDIFYTCVHIVQSPIMLAPKEFAISSRHLFLQSTRNNNVSLLLNYL